MSEEFEPEAYCKSIKDEIEEHHGEDAIDVVIEEDSELPFGDITMIIYYGTKKE